MALPVAAQARGWDEEDLGARATAAMGGAKLLSRVKALKWDGRAELNSGDTVLEIAMQTRVEPFGTAMSRSWVERHGSWTARTMVIAPDGSGHVEQEGKRTPLPAAQALHERHQFAIYGHMLMVHSQLRTEGEELIAERDGLPPIRFTLGSDGRPVIARYRLASPEGREPIDETLAFSGRVRSPDGIAWPDRITVSQKDFVIDIKLDAFAVELA